MSDYGSDSDPGVSRGRWWLKKMGRRGFLAASGRGRSSGGAEDGVVRILMYHRFGNAIRDPFTVAERDFRDQMEWVAEQGRAINVDQLLDYLNGCGSVPPGAVMISIDDGSQSLLDVAAPILRDCGVPAVAFIVSDLVGNDGARASMPEPFLDWAGVQGLLDFGIELGSHGLDHQSFGVLTGEEVHDQICRSRADIEAAIGCTPRVLSYPYGTQAHYTLDARVSAQACYYDLAVTAVHGPVRPQSDPFLLPRVKVEGGETLDHFAKLCNGGLDHWHLVDSMSSQVTKWRRRRSP